MNKNEWCSFGNTRLRDQWEQKAQSIAEQNKQEKEWQKKSTMSVLVSKWSYHHSLLNKGKSGPSDFQKVTSHLDEENKKTKIRFKVVAPPPPRPKTPPPAAPPVTRRRDSPKLKAKRKVEVDVFKICWKDSWMSLKPPKYLFLKALELQERLGFTIIYVCTEVKYKAQPPLKESKATLIDLWSHSWKKMKGPVFGADFDEEEFEWERLCAQRPLRAGAIASYSLPVWAGTWKIMNFAFRQQKPMWDHLWSNYDQTPTDRLDLILNIDEEATKFEGQERDWR